jgi:hypothetical protein
MTKQKSNNRSSEKSDGKLGFDAEGKYDLDTIQRVIDRATVDYDQREHFKAFRERILKSDYGELMWYQRRAEFTLEENKRKTFSLDQSEDETRGIGGFQITLMEIGKLERANKLLSEMLRVIAMTMQHQIATQAPFDGNALLSRNASTTDAKESSELNPQSVLAREEEDQKMSDAKQFARDLRQKDWRKGYRTCAAEAVKRFFPNLEGKARLKKD